MTARSRGAVPLAAAFAVTALATGIAIGALLTTIARDFYPPVSSRWFVLPLVLAPVVLASLLASWEPLTRLANGWNLTALLVLCHFFLAGLVCLIPWVKSLGALAAMSLVFGLASAAAVLLEAWLADLRASRTAWRYPVQGAFAALGVYLIVGVFRSVPGTASFYAGAGLYLLSALLLSHAGRAEIDRA